MDPIEPTCFVGRLVIFAKDQPQYMPLPARLGVQDFGTGRLFESTEAGLAAGVQAAHLVPTVITEWRLTEEERALIARGENIRLRVLTFGDPLQPVQITVTTPEGD